MTLYILTGVFFLLKISTIAGYRKNFLIDQDNIVIYNI